MQFAYSCAHTRTHVTPSTCTRVDACVKTYTRRGDVYRTWRVEKSNSHGLDWDAHNLLGKCPEIYASDSLAIALFFLDKFITPAGQIFHSRSRKKGEISLPSFLRFRLQQRPVTWRYRDICYRKFAKREIIFLRWTIYLTNVSQPVDATHIRTHLFICFTRFKSHYR